MWMVPAVLGPLVIRKRGAAVYVARCLLHRQFVTRGFLIIPYKQIPSCERGVIPRFTTERWDASEFVESVRLRFRERYRTGLGLNED